MKSNRQNGAKIINKRIVFGSMFGIIAVAAVVCGILLFFNHNIDIGEVNDLTQEQSNEIVSSTEDDHLNDENGDSDAPVEDANKEQSAPTDTSARPVTDNTNPLNEPRDNPTVNNTEQRVASIPTCSNETQTGVLPTSNECNATLRHNTGFRVSLRNITNNQTIKNTYVGSVSDTNVLILEGKNGQSIVTVKMNGPFFTFRTFKPGKSDLVIWEKYNSIPLLTIHITVPNVTVPEVKLAKIIVSCPDRNTVMGFAESNPNTWIDGPTVSYEPSDATLSSDSIVSIQPNEFINIRRNETGPVPYSVQPLSELQNYTGDIVITVTNGAISGSCTF